MRHSWSSVARGTALAGLLSFAMFQMVDTSRLLGQTSYPSSGMSLSDFQCAPQYNPGDGSICDPACSTTPDRTYCYDGSNPNLSASQQVFACFSSTCIHNDHDCWCCPSGSTHPSANFDYCSTSAPVTGADPTLQEIVDCMAAACGASNTGPAVCGDGTTEGSEECDDGNTDNNDGCSSSCKDEECGDGIAQSNEECDDGNSSNTDSCTKE